MLAKVPSQFSPCVMKMDSKGVVDALYLPIGRARVVRHRRVKVSRAQSASGAFALPDAC